MADAAVQGSVASALHAITGMPLNNTVCSTTESRPSSAFNSMSIPIDSRVDPKLRAKIWSNEFFEFGLLLNSSPSEGRYSINVATPSGLSVPTLCLEPTQKAKSIPNIEVWTSAFQVFVGVYTVKYPSEAPSLMKYSEVVRDLAARGGDWRYYDNNFRYLRQQNAVSMPWGETHWELWIRSQQFSAGNMQARGSKGPPSSTFIPKGYCRKFHTGIPCAGCSYKHQCFKCNNTHPVTNCLFRVQRGSRPEPSLGARSRAPNPNPGKQVNSPVSKLP